MATATNPFNESGIIAILRAKGISSNDVDDDALIQIISSSLDEWLFFRPKVCITSYATSITTVADTPNYAKPTAALWVREVGWNPDVTNSEYDDLWREILMSNYGETEPSMLLLDYGKVAQLHRLFKGHWQIRNDQIWLLPCPQGVYNVAVIYAGSRTLDELDEIADYRFLDLCYFNGLMAVATRKLTGGGWRAGQLSVSESVGRETMKVAERGLEKTRLLLANNYKMGRS